MSRHLNLCAQAFMALCAMFVITLSSPSCAQVHLTSPTDFDTDVRLNAAVSITAAGLPVSDLLKRLSQNDLTLNADHACADQKLQLCLKNRPLRAIMRSLAQLLPGYWRPRADQKGYRLEMDVRAVSRREEWWNLFLGERQKVLGMERAQVLQALRGDWKPWNGGNSQDAATDKQEAAAHIDHDLFHQLPADLQQRIADNISELPFYQTPITFRSEQEEGALAVPLSQLPSEWQQKLSSNMASNPALAQGTDWRQGSVLFLNGGSGILANYALSNGQSLGSFCELQIAQHIPPTLSLQQSQLPALVQKMGDKAPEAWKRLAEYAGSRVWKNQATKENVRFSLMGVRRVDVLNWLNAKANMEFIADYYSLPGHAMTPAERAAPLARPLKEELDFRAVQLDTK